jgi:hypothetical protein
MLVNITNIIDTYKFKSIDLDHDLEQMLKWIFLIYSLETSNIEIVYKIYFIS